MNYQSFIFIVFSGVVLLLYYVLGRRFQLKILGFGNLVFFIIAGTKYVPFILITIVTTYWAGRIMGQIYKDADEKLKACNSSAEKKEIRIIAKKKAKSILIFSIIISVGMLVVCKYTPFIIKNMNLLFSFIGIQQLTLFNMILPIGISFYTFMALSYQLDIYWKRYEAENNFLLVAVYLSYFPHVIQGPIDRFNEFKAQVQGGTALSYKNITFGAQLTIWGFFKKLVIADRLGFFVDTVIGSWESNDGIWLITAFAVYSIQIYADFSGCIDIVSGISEMFGIHLRKNFNHPYFSKTMAEFWRRWHISLQEWFKDYIYFPISTSSWLKQKKKLLKTKGKEKEANLFNSCFPILAVWLITGIWHGAAWKFVAWGLYHAILLIISQIFSQLVQRIIKLIKLGTDNFGWRLIQMIRTYILCCIGRVFFRADSLIEAIGIFKQIFLSTSFCALFCQVDYGLDLANVILAILSVVVLWCVDMLQEKYALRETLAKQNVIFRWFIIFCGIFSVMLFGIYGPEYDASSFIYEQF